MVHAIKGFNDILPSARDAHLSSHIWARIAAAASQTFGEYGYSHVFLPACEDTELFSRSIGEATDVVSKEMYSFEDRGGRSMTLRPEGTAGAARAYVEHHLGREEPVQKWWYLAPMFRAERPQKGRYRQFHQIGAEYFGAGDVAADVEILLLLRDFCAALGLQDYTIRLNSLGDDASRAAYREALLGYFAQHQGALCESCRTRLQRNPLRVLDCKRPDCQALVHGAPDVMDALSAPARGALDALLGMLAAVGIDAIRDRTLVRGLDYYTGLIFEFVGGHGLGAQDALLGGGHYDKLVSELGGPPTPALGFAAGIERLAIVLAATEAGKAGADLEILPMDAAAALAALKLAAVLRRPGGLRINVDTSGAKLKQQMRRADKTQARAVLVLGEREIGSGQATLKTLATGATTSVALSAEALRAALTEPGAARPK